MAVGVIGLGNVGTAIGNLIAGNGHEVLGWEHNPQVVESVNTTQHNERYLPGVALNPSLRATGDLTTVLAACSPVFISLPSVFIPATLSPVAESIAPGTALVNMAKGIDRVSGLTTFQMLGRLFPRQPCMMLAGPAIASEFARHMPTTVVLAGPDRSDLLAIARLLDNDTFRTRFTDDTIGAELGGILKNIYAIGLGLFDGLSVTSVNFRAVYLTIALEEIARFGVAMGARLETFLYLSGVGDLLATSLSQHSHNRRMGELLAKGLDRAGVQAEMGVLPEGYNTLHTALYIAEKLHVPMPLAHGLLDVINGTLNAERFTRVFIRDFVE